MEFKMPDNLEARPKRTKAPKASEWHFVEEGDKHAAGHPSGAQTFFQVRATSFSPVVACHPVVASPISSAFRHNNTRDKIWYYM
jgi:hypothetical protein